MPSKLVANIKRQFSIHKGFTLIELMLVIAIISMMTMLAYANYQKLKESQNLKNGAYDIQSLIRQAQSSAVSRLNCNNGNGASWSVVFTDNSHANLQCQVSGSAAVTIKTVALLNNIRINSVTGSCQANYPVTISFAPLSSVVTFADSNVPTCVGSSSLSSITVSLINGNTGDIRNFKISKGGAIDAQ